MKRIFLDKELNLELDGEVTYGSSSEYAYEGSNFYVDIADAPIPVHLTSLIAKHDLGTLPDVYFDHDLWLVPHRVAIHRRQGLWEVTEVGMEVNFKTGGRTLSIVSLFPGPKTLTIGSAGINLETDINAKVDWKHSLDDPMLSSLKLGVAAGGRLAMAANATISIPSVAASGEGSTRCAWQFLKDQEPLFGKTVECWSLVAVNRMETRLSWSTKVYVTFRAVFFPRRVETKPVGSSCRLLKRSAE
ncbi:MAG: hypothetical protein EOP84_05165 [Verrucomicrobiaceae bacterium]|nr:MAG: hypothetical protein EOP84_05165 [Verrucomicrobiaceae bacterium]